MAGLLFLALAYFAFGQASTSRSDAQGAADAAALAAANDVRQQLGEGLIEDISTPDEWESLLRGHGFLVHRACDSAREFAAKNGADSLSCEAKNTPLPEFTVSVKNQESIGDTVIPGTTGLYAQAVASAVIEPRCRVEMGDETKGSGEESPPVELHCNGEEFIVDTDQPDSVPDFDQLFVVRLSE
ncbi:pilus assembly protein TadG-related protein [Streptomyces sp. WMMC1477]|uniref:pilus assembly protein TadG-related protein n=1 Tax=Streptomyces sp. WMMC1477 TaxID=3015155 RepID=UPI0022B695D2|nr:pilus assembly protein TadG-related protein [Streptomyces sp. WMMC1477]MCZ7433405.1 pilus assembly protein TadG-related protein [Streptomyces sp. WMMC1477]